MHLSTIRVNNKLDAFFNVFISLLYVFRATQSSSSGQSIASINHLVYITLYRWLSGMQVSDLHTRQPLIQSDIYQMIYWCNWLSWWWALGCPKHVEKWNKHIKECVKLVINTNWNHIAYLAVNLIMGLILFITVPNNFVFPQAVCHLCYVNKSPLFKSALITTEVDANSIQWQRCTYNMYCMQYEG